MFDGNIAVVGVGTVGSMTMWKLSEITHDVVGFEASTISHDNSAVGGDTRLFRRIYKEGLYYNDLLAQSSQLWDELEHALPDVFYRGGALNIVRHGSQAHQALIKFATHANLDYHELENESLEKLYPQFKLNSSYKGLYDPAGGYIRTDLAVELASSMSLDSGATINEGIEISRVHSDSSGVTLEATTGETWRFKQAIITGGGRSSKLLPEKLRPYVQLNRIVMTWFTASNPELYSRSNFPVFSLNDHDIGYMYGAPTIDGSSVKISGFIPFHPVEYERFNFDQSVTVEERLHSATLVQRVFNDVSPRPVRATAYPESFTPDDDPVIDYVDEHQRVLVATGFSGKGFKMAPALGAHIANHIHSNEPLIANFSLSRFH
ncbi:MAG: FAD-dependent oxidoreductase [Alteromonadaceae bacterium]|nr:FAD-dependent oxidoreductase [Alteromonadaceae bacterium]